eukprot:GHVN01006097.1.p1 GENE.GHVN01006097.1~~GHVN01006097.1.p1  ORF type:complete len:796 (-),score=142.36 GHVN01006097.1:214-2601(-)
MWKGERPDEEEWKIQIGHSLEYYTSVTNVVMRRDLMIAYEARVWLVNTTLGEDRAMGWNEGIEYAVGKGSSNHVDMMGFTSSQATAKMCSIGKEEHFATAWLIDNQHHWNHEYGHTLGIPDCYQGCPSLEGRTYMNGNKVNRFNDGDLSVTKRCLENQGELNKRDEFAYKMDQSLKTLQVAPYARSDFVVTKPGEEIFIDVLANDFDANGDEIALHYVETGNEEGHVVKVKYADADHHPRDGILYRSNLNSVNTELHYGIIDKTGRVGHGIVFIRHEVPNSLMLCVDADDEYDPGVEGWLKYREKSTHNVAVSERWGFEFNITTPFGLGMNATGTKTTLHVPRQWRPPVFTFTAWMKWRDSKTSYMQLIHTTRDEVNWDRLLKLRMHNWEGSWYEVTSPDAKPWVDLYMDGQAVPTKEWVFFTVTLTKEKIKTRVIPFKDVFGFEDSADGTEESGGESNDESMISASGTPDWVAEEIYFDDDRYGEIMEWHWKHGAEWGDDGVDKIQIHNGYLDEVRYYNVELDDDDVVSLARQGHCQYDLSSPFDNAVVHKDDLVDNSLIEGDNEASKETSRGVILRWPPVTRFGKKGARGTDKTESLPYIVYAGWSGRMDDLQLVGETHESEFFLPLPTEDMVGDVLHWCIGLGRVDGARSITDKCNINEKKTKALNVSNLRDKPATTEPPEGAPTTTTDQATTSTEPLETSTDDTGEGGGEGEGPCCCRCCKGDCGSDHGHHHEHHHQHHHHKNHPHPDEEETDIDAADPNHGEDGGDLNFLSLRENPKVEKMKKRVRKHIR